MFDKREHLWSLSVIRKAADCEYLPIRLQRADCETLFGLCWSPTLVGIQDYISGNSHKSWASSGERLVIHKPSGKVHSMMQL